MKDIGYFLLIIAILPVLIFAYCFMGGKDQSEVNSKCDNGAE